MKKRETFSQFLERLALEYMEKNYPEDYEKFKEISTTSPSRIITLSTNSR